MYSKIFYRSLTIHPCKCIKATTIGLEIECINTNLASLSVALANIAELEVPIEYLLIDKSNFGILNENF